MVIAALMWRGWVPYRKRRLRRHRRTDGNGLLLLHPGNLGVKLLTRDLGAGRTEIIALSWWSDVDHIRAFTGEQLSSPSITPKTTSTSEPRSPLFEVAAHS
jgi:hypothetical protein